MKIKNILKLIVLAAAMLLGSCNDYKNFVYFQDASNSIEKMKITQQAVVKARKGDVINIFISSRNAESSIPFNLTAQGYRPGSGSGDIFTSSATQRSLSYHVNDNGCIEFPQLGTISVVGLSRDEISEVIKKKLTDAGFLKDPIVTVDFIDLKISVLGEVNRPGSYSMNNDHTTLLEALSLAGDLTAYGCRDRVAVIREENGERTIVWHDLRSKDIFDSPFYYLQQNDVVYVEPNHAKATQSTQSRWNQPSVWISLISTAISVTTLIRLFAKD